jgi:hypothetical protein
MPHPTNHRLPVTLIPRSYPGGMWEGEAADFCLILLLRRILESYISRSPTRPGGPPAFCRQCHREEHDPSKGFPHETAHCPRIRFGSGSRHDRLLLHPLLQFPLWHGRRLRPQWLRRPGNVELRPGLFELRGVLSTCLRPRGAVGALTLHSTASKAEIAP